MAQSARIKISVTPYATGTFNGRISLQVTSAGGACAVYLPFSFVVARPDLSIHFSELDERSELSMWNVQLHDFDMLCALKGNANFRSYVCSFDAIDLGFKLDESTFELEPFMLYRPKQQNFKQLKSS